MDWTHLATILATLGTLIAGGILEWFRQWLTTKTATKPLRRLTREELATLAPTLNFFLLTALDPTNTLSLGSLQKKYFGVPLKLKAFSFYATDKTEIAMQLPECLMLSNWNNKLQSLSAISPEETVISAISLLSMLTVELRKLPSRETLEFVKRILERPEVSGFRSKWFMNRASLSK